MRYLMDAIGEDASLFDDMNQAYAITDLQGDVGNAASAIQEAEWLAKEIAAIFFRRRVGQDPFAPLWESIHLWAEWARNETSWVKAQLKEKTANRYAENSAIRARIHTRLVVGIKRQRIGRGPSVFEYSQRRLRLD